MAFDIREKIFENSYNINVACFFWLLSSLLLVDDMLIRTKTGTMVDTPYILVLSLKNFEVISYMWLNPIPAQENEKKGLQTAWQILYGNNTPDKTLMVTISQTQDQHWASKAKSASVLHIVRISSRILIYTKSTILW